MRVRVLRNQDYRRMRWKNGGGWTTELAAHPADADAFDWRISIADIESDGAFSTFAGCDRYIAMLEGIGMQLEFDAAPAERLDQRLRFLKFSGDWQTRGRLISGPVRDFNVIVRRDAIAADVLFRPLVGPMVFLPESGTTWFVYLVGGQARLKHDDAPLEAGEALLLQPDATPADDGNQNTRPGTNVVLTGGGEVVLVKLQRKIAAGSA
jgi:environmental stress-induced protein Ves